MSFTGRAMVLIGVANLLFGFGIGIPLTYFVYDRSRDRDAALDRVETTEGVVTKSEVERVRDPGHESPKYRYKPIVEFRYDYDGETYRSNRRAYEMLFGRTNESSANRTARTYSEGTQVSVYVDPEDPGNGFLEVDDTRQNVVTVFGLIVGMVLVFMGIAGAAVLGAALFVV